jgi:hypothetical protein
LLKVVLGDLYRSEKIMVDDGVVSIGREGET